MTARRHAVSNTFGELGVKFKYCASSFFLSFTDLSSITHLSQTIRWRMNQCMANEEYRFIKGQDKCESKIDFEDWEDTGHFGSTSWTDTFIFDTVEECCANNFGFDYDGCVGRSPIQFKFEFCVAVKGLVDPQDCQSADIFANVLEDTINEGWSGSSAFTADISADTNITKIGDVSLSKVLGSTVCGGSLAGGSFINELTGTMPNIEAASNNTIEVCGVITVEEELCRDESCLMEHYQTVKAELTQYVNNGNFTVALNRRATTRLPPVIELYSVSGVSSSFTAQSLLLPATVTGEFDYKYFQGTNLETCDKKPASALMRYEVGYDKLSDCCSAEFQWNTVRCCAKGGGCTTETVGGVSIASSPVSSPTRFYPTWKTGQLCESKPSDQLQSWEQHYATRNECCEKHFNYGNELSICNAATP